MAERITSSNVQERVANLNRRMIERDSVYTYRAERRNGGTSLDRYRGSCCVSLVRAGTTGEIAEFLHAMMTALDDASVVAS